MIDSTFLLFSIAVAVVAWTVSSEQVFAPVRNYVANKSEWLGRGIHCPFCVGGWASLLALLLIYPIPDELSDYPVLYFLMVGCSGLITTLYAILRQVWKLLMFKALMLEDLRNHQLKRMKTVETRWPQIEELPDNPTHADRLASVRRI